MRAVALRQPVITPEGTLDTQVMVGVTLKARDALVRQLWLRGFLEQAALVLAAALSILFGISRELRPLLRLRQSVRDSPADSFKPLEVAGVQSEIRPLVQALNDHMGRLGGYLDRQRRFLDSTAHQMRTPLAVMKTQVEVARRSGAEDEMRAVLAEVDRGLSAMSRLMTQLLTLGRADHLRAQLSRQSVDLRAVVQEVASAMAPRVLDAGIEMVVDADAPCTVAASALLLHEVVANLLDNTIRHAGAGVTVVLRVETRGDDGLLGIQDNGPGLSADEAAHIFTRFRRGRNAGEGGSGLGLAIVAEIAELSGGTVRFDPPAGTGFGLVMTLPLYRA
jgi:two-component system sensor histidine kinase TctE